MEKEIRGLQAGDYCVDDSVFLRVRRTDEGVIMEIVDREADVFYAFTVNENQETKFEFGQASTA